MSGHSASLTFPVEPDHATAVSEAVNAGDTSIFDDYVNEAFLSARSRNNWVEFFTKRLIESFGEAALPHLTAGIDSSGTPRQGWFVAALNEAELSAAIMGIERLLDWMQQDVQRTARLLGGIFVSDHDAHLLTNPPSSLHDAIKRSEACCSINEGDDPATLFSFLQAHLEVLRFAKSKKTSAIYAVWLY